MTDSTGLITSYPHPLGTLNRHDCGECSRLWREYSQRATAHIHLMGKHRIAKLQNDREGIALLDPKLSEAELERVAARDAIRQHETADHNGGRSIACEDPTARLTDS
jgi:hypothetical protein